MAWPFSSEGGASHGAVRKMTSRETFSAFLPYVAYDDAEGVYHTLDNCKGYLYEFEPVAFADNGTLQRIIGLINTNFGPKTVLQFILFACPFIGEEIGAYMGCKTRDDPLVRANAVSFVKHILDQHSGMTQMYGIPIRKFRGRIAIKDPKGLDSDKKAVVEEALKKLGVRPIRPDGDFGLLAQERRFFKDMREAQPGTYDRRKPLNKQIIDAGAPIEFTDAHVRFGAHYGRCLTPQAMPERITPQMVNRLCGGMMGLNDDPEQITGPFIVSLNVTFDNVAGEIATKSQVISAQRAGGAIANQIGKMVSEYHWAIDHAKSEKFVRVIPTVWVFGFDEDQCRDNAARVRRLYETQSFALQEESYLSKALFLASLPFGLIIDGANLKTLDRHFVMPVETAGVLAPVQGDFEGAGRPVQVFIGRKGQIAGFDLFDRRLNNHNFVVSAESGAGKSFLLNNLCYQYYAGGAAIRIVDIGYSYEKNCKLLGGRFIDIGGEQIVLNPFDAAIVDNEEREIAIQASADVLALMATSGAGAKLNETELN
ncbi:MAG: TraC family protein, partial [Pseudomonadota bacterium]